MKNQLFYAPDGRGLKLKLPLPAGAKIGVPVVVGPGGMIAVPFTDRVTPELRAAGKAPQGLRNGEASCFIPGLGLVIDLGPMPAGVVTGQKLYLSAAGALTTLNTDTYVGYAIPLPEPMVGFGVGVRGN